MSSIKKANQDLRRLAYHILSMPAFLAYLFVNGIFIQKTDGIPFQDLSTESIFSIVVMNALVTLIFGIFAYLIHNTDFIIEEAKDSADETSC